MIFGPNREKVTGDWRKLQSVELHNLYFTKYHSGYQVEENEMVVGMRYVLEERRNSYKVLVKPEGKTHLERPGRRWEGNSEMDLQKVGWGSMDWIDVAQDVK